MNEIEKQDYEYIRSRSFIHWEKFSGKRFLVTGATGLIGQNLIKALLYSSEAENLGIHITALVRDVQRAERLFADIQDKTALSFVEGDVTSLPRIAGEIDFIIHGASATDSGFFISHPVETLRIAVDGTANLLKLAQEKRANGMVYLSSMEVYGHPERGHAVTESESAGFDPTNVRNSYPLSKQICESLCTSYAAEYQLPVMCIRLTQTFGPGVRMDDRRVFAEFMRSVLTNQDIVLKTKGETERCYLYTADCVTAILTVLQKGKAGVCYNAANPDTYCSILEMAELVAEKVAEGRIKVLVQLEDTAKLGYASTLYMQLDVSKLRELGWNSAFGLEKMFHNMIQMHRSDT